MQNIVAQVDKAFEHMLQYYDVPERNIRFNMTIGESKRGIYLRELHEVQNPSDHNITVEPIYMEKTSGQSQVNLKLSFYHENRNCLNIYVIIITILIIIIIIIWFGDTVTHVAPYKMLYKLKTVSHVSLTSLSTPFPAGGSPSDTASSTLSKTQTWPQFNHHAPDNNG